ncbi:HD-GYP domain-containing protein [Paludibacterium paludis]|uniref:Two-component system response regulator n=1 Tax=Paludibacterium paludis TaxID=1225769 RepID=A0A918NYT9_9NEIS|nr:HD domain-containing phosphohydrolase [Paludibacterium paludis]GGY07733.1 two-component system response regulator [Paludibacterium paludis]
MAILIVDDNSTNLILMTALARSVAEVEPVAFENPFEALAWSESHDPDLVLVDYMMPELDGHEFIRRFRAIPDRQDVPIVMITTENERPIRQKALELGATEFLAKPIDSVEFRIRVRNLLALSQARQQLSNRSQWLAEEVARATQVIRLREQELVLRLSRAAEYRDPETGAHINRMSSYAALIARGLGCEEEFVANLKLAAPMHDIGKLGIPDYILLKPGRLTPEELHIMQGHAEIGARILSGSHSPLIQLASRVAAGHHEKFDGTGYPLGLKGEAIPLEARIVAVADVFDALTSERPYKKPWPFDEARRYIEDGRGKHFCPRCVDAFCSNWEGVLGISREFPDDVPDEGDLPAEFEGGEA